MTELVSLSLRRAFREFCVSYLIVRDIEEIFLGYGVTPGELGEDELQRLSGVRRALVEQFYKTLDWASIRDTEVFLEIVSHVLEIHYPYRPEATNTQEELKELCRKSGFVVNGNRVSFPVQGGVKGRVKNLIFASIGEKPEIVLRDSVNNDIQIVKNEQNCLVYDQPIPERGLLWKDLVEWWGNKNGNSALERNALEKSLYQRLLRSLTSSVPEQILFKTYMREIVKSQQEREKLLSHKAINGRQNNYKVAVDPRHSRSNGDVESLARKAISGRLYKNQANTGRLCIFLKFARMASHLFPLVLTMKNGNPVWKF